VKREPTRNDIVRAVAAGVLEGAAKALRAHGDDDKTREILRAGLAIAIGRIDARLFCGFTRDVEILLRSRP
jgi:hypothetical protein